MTRLCKIITKKNWTCFRKCMNAYLMQYLPYIHKYVCILNITSGMNRLIFKTRVIHKSWVTIQFYSKYCIHIKFLQTTYEVSSLKTKDFLVKKKKLFTIRNCVMVKKFQVVFLEINLLCIKKWFFRLCTSRNRPTLYSTDFIICNSLFIHVPWFCGIT